MAGASWSSAARPRSPEFNNGCRDSDHSLVTYWCLVLEKVDSTVNLATGLLLQQCPFFQTPMNHGYLPENIALGVLFSNSHDHNGFSPTSTAK
jgi:hypothetical protein